MAAEDVASLARRIRKLQQLLPTEARPLKPYQQTVLRKLDRLRERWRWLLIVDGHEREGCVSPIRANELRALVLNGESVAAEPLDDTPQTRRWAQERSSVGRALERDARRLRRPGFRLLTRRPRLRSRRRRQRNTTRTAHGPPGRSTDDDPHERPLARLARLLGGATW